MTYARQTMSLTLAAMLSLAAGTAHAQKGETVKLAWIDPLSGLMAPLGQNQLKSFQFMAEKFNKNNPAGVKFELVPIDNKLSPLESLSALKSAIDNGVRYVLQGTAGSAVALALNDAITKHNERNPGKEVLFINYAAAEPDLTNSKCSFWHFRFDADTAMKMEALTTFMKDEKGIKKVYLINQNYVTGQKVSLYAKEMLQRKRPDIKIVGDDLHPLAQVRDFAPYVAKIKASGADTVITGNWSSDLTLLIKAANEAGMKDVKFYTYFAGVPGTPTAIGAGAAGHVYQVASSYSGMTGEARRLMDEFKAKFNEDWYPGATYHTLALLSAGMAQAKSTDPVKVAFAMEGMRFKSVNGELEMRKTDHQLQLPQYISVWQKAGKAPNDYSLENTGYNFALVKGFDSYVSNTPTSCQMKRPSVQ